MQGPLLGATEGLRKAGKPAMKKRQDAVRKNPTCLTNEATIRRYGLNATTSGMVQDPIPQQIVFSPVLSGRCLFGAAVEGVPSAWVAQRLLAVLSAYRGVSGVAHDGRPNEAGPARHQGRTLVQITSRGKRVRFRLPAHSAPNLVSRGKHMGRTTSPSGWGRMSFAQEQPT